MSEPRDELSGGRHPDADDPLSRPLLHGWSPSRSVSRWAAGHRLVAAALAVVALAAVGGGLWARHSAERVVPADSLRVQADPSEYFLPGQLDDQGRTELLMLLQVDVAANVDRPVRLVGLDGGGISAAETHSVTGSSARFTVRAQLACDLWLGGRGVQVRLRVGPGHGRPVNVPLDTGKVSPLGAQVTIPCEQFTRTHPLRLTSFGVSLDPTEPVLRSTWTVENRSATPILLSDALAVRFFGRDAPLAAPPPSQATLLEPHGTTTVIRDLAVTSCTGAQPMDPTGANLTLLGRSNLSAAPTDGLVRLELPPASVAVVYTTAQDACRGAPDLSGTTATLRLHGAPPGHGRAELRVAGTVALPGPWTVAIGDLSAIDADPEPPSGRAVMRLQGPAPFVLSAAWTVRRCNVTVTSPAEAVTTVDVTVSGPRTYPYELPVTAVGRTSCAPGDVRN